MPWRLGGAGASPATRAKPSIAAYHHPSGRLPHTNTRLCPGPPVDASVAPRREGGARGRGCAGEFCPANISPTSIASKPAAIPHEERDQRDRRDVLRDRGLRHATARRVNVSILRSLRYAAGVSQKRAPASNRDAQTLTPSIYLRLAKPVGKGKCRIVPKEQIRYTGVRRIAI